MIVSMTGFGDATAERDGTHYTVEIRSLNNRFFKPIIKLPENVSGLEPEIESTLRAARARLDHLHPEDAHGQRRGGVSRECRGAGVVSGTIARGKGIGRRGADRPGKPHAT